MFRRGFLNFLEDIELKLLILVNWMFLPEAMVSPDTHVHLLTLHSFLSHECRDHQVFRENLIGMLYLIKNSKQGNNFYNSP